MGVNGQLTLAVLLPTIAVVLAGGLESPMNIMENTQDKQLPHRECATEQRRDMGNLGLGRCSPRSLECASPDVQSDEDELARKSQLSSSSDLTAIAPYNRTTGSGRSSDLQENEQLALQANMLRSHPLVHQWAKEPLAHRTQSDDKAKQPPVDVDQAPSEDEDEEQCPCHPCAGQTSDPKHKGAHAAASQPRAQESELEQTAVISCRQANRPPVYQTTVTDFMGSGEAATVGVSLISPVGHGPAADHGPAPLEDSRCEAHERDTEADDDNPVGTAIIKPTEAADAQGSADAGAPQQGSPAYATNTQLCVGAGEPDHRPAKAEPQPSSQGRDPSEEEEPPRQESAGNALGAHVETSSGPLDAARPALVDAEASSEVVEREPGSDCLGAATQEEVNTPGAPCSEDHGSNTLASGDAMEDSQSSAQRSTPPTDALEIPVNKAGGDTNQRGCAPEPRASVGSLAGIRAPSDLDISLDGARDLDDCPWKRTGNLEERAAVLEHCVYEQDQQLYELRSVKSQLERALCERDGTLKEESRRRLEAEHHLLEECVAHQQRDEELLADLQAAKQAAAEARADAEATKKRLDEALLVSEAHVTARSRAEDAVASRDKQIAKLQKELICAKAGKSTYNVSVEDLQNLGEECYKHDLYNRCLLNSLVSCLRDARLAQTTLGHAFQALSDTLTHPRPRTPQPTSKSPSPTSPRESQAGQLPRNIRAASPKFSTPSPRSGRSIRSSMAYPPPNHPKAGKLCVQQLRMLGRKNPALPAVLDQTEIVKEMSKQLQALEAALLPATSQATTALRTLDERLDAAGQLGITRR